MNEREPNGQATVLYYRLKYKTNNKLLTTDNSERNPPLVSIKFFHLRKINVYAFTLIIKKVTQQQSLR